MVLRLVHSDRHLFNQNAIGGNTITLLNMDNIADNKILHPDRLCSTISASVHSNFFLVDFILESEELFIFAVVAERCNDGLCEQTKIYCQALNIAV